MHDYKAEMGLRIQNKRKIIKLTQEQLAEMLGISVKHLSEVERGIAGLSIENLIHLSSIFDTSIDYLVKGEEINDPQKLIITLPENITEEKTYKVKEIIRRIIDVI